SGTTRSPSPLSSVPTLFNRGSCAIGSSRRALVQPLPDDRDGFLRVLLRQFADLVQRLRVYLALHLRDIDHLCGLARRDRADVAIFGKDGGRGGTGGASPAGVAAGDSRRGAA